MQCISLFSFDTLWHLFYDSCMSKNLLFETESVLAELRNIRSSIEKAHNKLSKFEAVSLHESRRKGSSKSYFYMVRKGSRKREYLGDEANSQVDLIKKARYIKEWLSILDKDIELLEKLSDQFIIPEHSVINSRLPAVYQSKTSLFTAGTSEPASKWKAQKEAEKASYEPYKPEDLVHMAADGTMMRSNPEVIIANYLLSLGITFVYELPLNHHGKRILPDFTILSPLDNKTVIIIEHQGAMASEQYQIKFIRTILFYLRTKKIPNKDVFFTFNHLDGNLDLRQIDSILHIAFGFDPSCRQS